jgi:predicted acyl esterase
MTFFYQQITQLLVYCAEPKCLKCAMLWAGYFDILVDAMFQNHFHVNIIGEMHYVWKTT